MIDPSSEIAALPPDKPGSRIVRRRFCFSSVFNLHVAKFLGVEDFATVQALDELGVLVTGNDSNPGMSARAGHCLYRLW